jgi:hypothetical protein
MVSILVGYFGFILAFFFGEVLVSLELLLLLLLLFYSE